MLHAMRSMMLHRSGIDDLLPRHHDSDAGDVRARRRMGWRPDEARRTCAAIPDCRVEEVAGGGHVAPLLIDRDRIAAAAHRVLGRSSAESASPCRPSRA